MLTKIFVEVARFIRNICGWNKQGREADLQKSADVFLHEEKVRLMNGDSCFGNGNIFETGG
jgi:hypothetical protein